MAIAVDGYGNITKGNAKEIYTAWKRGEVELNKSQQTKCESFLSPEEMDEVQYDSQVTTKRGQDSIDTEGTDDKGNGVAASACGTVVAAATSICLNKVLAGINGFSSLAAAIVSMCLAAASLGFAIGYDSQLDDRNNHSGNAESDNATMDQYSEALGQTMEMMNEDVELYNEQQDVLTTTVNTQASQGADLQMQYDAAMAVGDAAKAQSLKEQMKALSEQDNSQLEADLEETGGAIEEYRAMNAESLGCAESGQTVSDFLKDGKPKGVLAMVSGGLCALAVVAATISGVIGGIPKIWALCVPVDGVPAIASSIMWAAIAGMMGTASGMFFKKGNQELECASNGEGMQEHVNNLRDMAEQQSVYTDDTQGQFEESDEAAAESKAEASEAAGEAVDGNKENLGNKPKEKEKETAAA